jgi:hypothetical protein
MEEKTVTREEADFICRRLITPKLEDARRALRNETTRGMYGAIIEGQIERLETLMVKLGYWQSR